MSVDNSVEVMKPNETVFSDLIGVGYPASTQVRKFFPTQSSFSPANNICRIYLNSPGFINLSDGVLSFKVYNRTVSVGAVSGNAYIDGSGHSFIDRLTVYGPDNTILEQIENYNILANAISDIQLSKDWRSTIGNSMCGYGQDPLATARPFCLIVTTVNTFLINGRSIQITNGGSGGNAGDGFSFTGTATAGSFVLGGQTLVCGAAATNASVVVNGILFESRVGSNNTLFVNGVPIDISAAAANTILRFDGYYVVGATEQLPNNGRSYSPFHQSEFLSAAPDAATAGGVRTFNLPLVSGVLQSNKYFPSQFASGQGMYIELQWAPAAACLYTPAGSTTTPNYTIDNVYYQAPVVNFAGNFYSEFKQVLDAGGIKWHVTNYQSNRRDYTGNTGVKTLTIGSKHRSLKSLICCLQNGVRTSVQVPKTSYRDLPTSGWFQARIGTVLYPPQTVGFNVDNVSELYAELQKAFATLGNIRSNSMIDRYNMFGGCGVIGLDFENYPQTSSSKLAESGLNTISNNQQFDLLINVETGLANNGNANIYLLHDIILMMTPDGRIIKSN